MTMLKDGKRRGETTHKFEAGGELGPIENRNESTTTGSPASGGKGTGTTKHAFRRLLSLLCWQKDGHSPSGSGPDSGTFDVLEFAGRIRILKDANQRLMEYLNDVGQDSKIRQ